MKTVISLPNNKSPRTAKFSVRVQKKFRLVVCMDMSIINRLEDFLEDIPFPIHKSVLVEEALGSSLPNNVREAISLLPDKEYLTREELKSELVGLPFDDGVPKKDFDTMRMEEVDDKMDSIVNLDDFTQMGDEEDHESV